jgi:thioredoxin 1
MRRASATEASTSDGATARAVIKSEAAFADALRTHKSRLLVVNYGAEWCKHCAKLTPAIDALRERWGSEVAFVDADVDALPFTARAVRWTPTVAFYRNGRLVDECERAKPTQVADRAWLHACHDPDDGEGSSGRK